MKKETGDAPEELVPERGDVCFLDIFGLKKSDVATVAANGANTSNLLRHFSRTRVGIQRECNDGCQI